MNQLVPFRQSTLPELVTAAGERASLRFLEFFAANIRNPHTRRAYARAADEFLAWCASAGVPSIGAVQPVHVATWIEASTRELAAPSVKQRLAALRHLFDWLVNGQVVPINPAHTVRGPRHVVTSGRTPVLDPSEARALIDSIDTSTHAGLRDRALIALMVYSFARIGAALGMTVEDVFTQNRRLWVRLREKGGKRHAMPCHHNLEEYLIAYFDGAELRGDPKGPVFRTIGRGTGKLTRTVLPQANACLCDDPPACGGGRHRHQARQPQLPGDRDHRLP
jgi:site-specific recombinase XerC